MSQPGSSCLAIAVNAVRGARRRRVVFCMETPAIRLALSALARLLGCRIYLAELHELVVLLAADF